MGGWTLEAVEWVCNAEGNLGLGALEGVAALMDKSLLRREERSDSRSRFTMLESIREYARERLAEAGELEPTQERHLAYYLALAELAEPQVTGADQVVWLDRLAQDHDNLRAALAWSLERSDAETAQRLSGALWWFWFVRDYRHEGCRWLEAALGTPGTVPTAVRANALHGAGWLLTNERDYERAVALLQQSLAIARQSQDRGRTLTVLRDLGQAFRLQGDLRRAMQVLEECATLAREIGDERIAAWASHCLGMTAHVEGDNVRAVPLLDAAVAQARKLGDQELLAWALNVRGRAGKDRGECEQATRWFKESLTLFSDLVHQDAIAFTLEGMAGLAAAQAQGLRAARLFGAAEALRDAISSPMAPVDHAEYDRDVAATREQLDQPAWNAAWFEGRTMSLEQAIDYALEEPS